MNTVLNGPVAPQSSRNIAQPLPQLPTELMLTTFEEALNADFERLLTGIYQESDRDLRDGLITYPDAPLRKSPREPSTPFTMSTADLLKFEHPRLYRQTVVKLASVSSDYAAKIKSVTTRHLEVSRQLIKDLKADLRQNVIVESDAGRKVDQQSELTADFAQFDQAVERVNHDATRLTQAFAAELVVESCHDFVCGVLLRERVIAMSMRRWQYNVEVNLFRHMFGEYVDSAEH